MFAKAEDNTLDTLSVTYYAACLTSREIRGKSLVCMYDKPARPDQHTELDKQRTSIWWGASPVDLPLHDPSHSISIYY
jgi:hypothetical protein